MFSVNLDEALGLRRGEGPRGLATSLCRSGALPEFGSSPPRVASRNASSFPSPRYVWESCSPEPGTFSEFKKSAHRPIQRLLQPRSPYRPVLYKILALAEMVEELAQNYASAVVTLGFDPPAGSLLGPSGNDSE